MAGAAAEFLDKPSARGAMRLGVRGAEHWLHLRGLLFSEEEGEGGPFHVRERKHRHTVLAIELGGIGQPGSEEPGRAFLGDLRQVATAEPTAGPEIAPGMAGQATDREEECLAIFDAG